MQFKLEKASDWEFEEQVEISSLEELEELQKRFTEPLDPTNTTYRRGFDIPPLVVDFYRKEITVYDDYLE